MLASPTDMDTTPRQRRILEYIQETVRARGYPPTVREIGEAVGLTSSSSVHAQLENLGRRPDACLAQLLGSEEAVIVAANDDRVAQVRQSGEADQGLLQHGLAADQGQELLWKQGSGQRPEP